MALESFQLQGKTALITGAAGLLGVEHASALLEAGARVILTDIDEAELKRQKKRLSKEYKKNLIEVFKLDVTKLKSISKVLEDLKVLDIKVDILINNAAIDHKVKNVEGLKETTRLENFSLEQWNLEISVGLTGAFLCSQVFGYEMAMNGKGGVILNIASDLSIISPDQRLYSKEGLAYEEQQVKPVTYPVIKSGLIGLTRYLSTYWADKKVRCNALSPGGVYTQQDEVFVKKLKNLIPLDRMANKDEYRATVQYLCSDASAYMNGQNIVVDGGRSVW